MKYKNLWDLIVDVALGIRGTDKEKKKEEMSSFKSNLADCARFYQQEISLKADIQDGMSLESDGAWIIDVFSADSTEKITLKIPCDRSKPLELTETREVTKVATTTYNHEN